MQDRKILKYFAIACTLGLGFALVAVLTGCGDNEQGPHDWQCLDCPDFGSPMPSAPDARPLQTDAAPATSPDAPEALPDAPGAPDAGAGAHDAAPPVPDCTETCDEVGYCDGATCVPWPPIPPPESWDCGGESEGIGCCVSVCEHECDLNLPNSLWTACENSCELRCKTLLDH